MITYDNPLAAKVAARNNVNDLANNWYAKAAEALKPFIGQKICKVDGMFLKKVKEALPEFPWNSQTQGHYSTANGYSVQFRLKTYEHTQGRNWTPEHPYQTAHYADVVLYLGDLTNGVLVKVYDAPAFKTDYDAAVIRQIRGEVRHAEELLRQANSLLGDFGMYDN